MATTTSTVRAWAIPPGPRCACCSCDLSHDDDEATDSRPTPERAPAARTVRVAGDKLELQDQVFAAALWCY